MNQGVCLYKVDEGCSSHARCVDLNPSGGAVCHAITQTPMCGCDGKTVNVTGGCMPIAPTYAPVAVSKTGACGGG